MPAGTAHGPFGDGRHCAVCGTPVRDPDNANAGLCHKHNPDRTSARAAQQRQRRYSTTVPPVRLTPPQAHWLHDAMTAVTIAENSLRSSRNNDTVTKLLTALDKLHKELDPTLDEISAVLKAYPSGVPPRPK